MKITLDEYVESDLSFCLFDYIVIYQVLFSFRNLLYREYHKDFFQYHPIVKSN